MSVCLIPARGGSKRVPRKNVRDFAGRPMIAWSIAAAQDAAVFDRIIVSTDDDEIARVAMTLGAEVPFRRPAALSDDHATTVQVVRHALEWLDSDCGAADLLCCLYATAPFVQAGDIRQGARMLDDWSFTMPVTTFPFPVQRAVTLDPSGGLKMLQPEHLTTRSQDLPEAWHDAGQFYCGHTAAWMGDQPIFGPETGAIPIPRWRVQDIDTPEDWRRAEAMFRALGLGRM